jgi:hypothetical protein
MNFLTLTTLGTAAVLAMVTPGGAQQHHKRSTDMPAKHPEKMSPRSALQPAEGASVDIITPKDGQVFKGDSVPLEFTMKKGKRGAHVHAYIDGHLMGMFTGTKGTLTGIKPGQHTLELRVATADHETELNAVDRVSFTTK